jgi:pantoate--beta-alanine ligase
MSRPLVIHDPADLAPFAGGAFVPTMGALHDGHLSLMRQARHHDGPVVASVFVNPTQFAPGEDFDAYPRGLDRDVELAGSAGCDVVYAPNAATMYPEGPDAAVAAAATFPLPEVAIRPRLEDGDRPRFFGGVCLVVTRLLRHVRPALAVFGEKDWQQLQVVTAMVAADPDLSSIRIEPGSLVRDPDGLAMSSRNTRIPPELRELALGVPRALQCAHAAQHPQTAERLMQETLEAHELEVDYAVIRDPASLLPVSDFTRPTRALVAARLRWDGDSVRLIDNAAMTVWR